MHPVHEQKNFRAGLPSNAFERPSPFGWTVFPRALPWAEARALRWRTANSAARTSTRSPQFRGRTPFPIPSCESEGFRER